MDISLEEARDLALARLREATVEDAISRAFFGDPIESAAFWVFPYNSTEFVETGDFLAGLAGNGPIVVPKDGSPLFELTSAEPVQPQIERLEKP